MQKRLNAKEVLTPTSFEKFILSIADGTVKLSGGDQVLRTSTLIRDRPDRGEEQGNLQGESDGSSSTQLQDLSLCEGEAGKDFWSSSGNYIYRHHVEPRVQLYVPREASFPIPLKCIDVTRATSASLHVMLEKNIEDYWNVNGDRELSDTWTSFTRFTFFDGYSWSGGRLTRKQTTSTPDTLWPKIWKDFSEASKRKEKQKWAIEKPRLHNARKLRGIYLIDPAGEELKDIRKTRVESWKFRCQLQCLAKLDARSTGRPAALKRSARQNTLPLSKPTSLRESAWKDLFIKIMKIILLEME